MKFRNRGNTLASRNEEEPAEVPPLVPGGQAAVRGRWSTTFLMVGSALVGATAIAFWNRRTISNMRAQIQANTGVSVSPHTVDEEIF